MREEVLIALVMSLILLVGNYFTKNDKRAAAIFLVVASIVGSLVAKMGIRFREIVEGPFAFLDSALLMVCGSIFFFLIYQYGILKLILNKVLSFKNKFLRSILLVCFIAFPAMLSGFAGLSIATSGRLVEPLFKDKKKATSIIAISSLIGMILPPSSLPVMIASNGAGSVLPTPYVGYALPLFILGFPALILHSILSMKEISSIPTMEKQKLSNVEKINLNIVRIMIIILLIDGLLASYVYLGGITLWFFVFSIILVLLNKGKLSDVSEGLLGCTGAVGFMLATGCFIEITSMTGVQGYYSMLILPYKVENVMLVLMGVLLIIGAFFGEALPGVIAAYAVFPIGWLANNVIVTGISSALALVSILMVRGGIIQRTIKRTNAPVKYKDIIVSCIPVCSLILLTGVLFVIFGDKLTGLIL